MKKIKVQVPVSECFSNNKLSVETTVQDIILPLCDGHHKILTEPVVIGNIDKVNIKASVQFPYHFDEKNKMLTFCDDDTREKEAYSVHVELGKSKAAVDKISSVRFHHSQVSVASDSVDSVPEHADLYSNLEKTITKAISVIAGQLRKNYINIRIRTAPPVLTSEDDVDKYIGIVKPGYRNDIETLSKPYKLKFYNEFIQSTWGGTVYFNINEAFANVIGSTGDNNIAGLSWIQLWQNQFGVANNCTSLNSANGGINNFQCSNSLVGGHVIVGQQAQYVQAGSNAVYIMPICHAHNNNNNIYMIASIYQNGIWLNNYHNP